MGGDKKLSFEEGVDSFVPYAGSLRDNVNLTLRRYAPPCATAGRLPFLETPGRRQNPPWYLPPVLWKAGVHDLYAEG